MMRGRVVSVNISQEKGTIKHAVASICIDASGVRGDAHSGAWHRQVSILARERMDVFGKQHGRHFDCGEFAENITVSGIDLTAVRVFDEVRVGTSILEVSQIGKECHGPGCAVFAHTGKCIMPKEGIFARVRKPGIVRPGDCAEVSARPVRAVIITASDRASRKEYVDVSGPVAEQAVRQDFAGAVFGLQVRRCIVPDTIARIRAAIKTALRDRADIIVITGGTGIGPRDITPEAVRPLLDKETPGLMEHIRCKYGATHPNALISRSLAGVIQKTLIYAIPGNPRAVKEYCAEIIPTLAHSLCMVRGIMIH